MKKKCDMVLSENKSEQAQLRAAMPACIVLPTHLEHLLYGFHCTSELRLFLTQFKCKCKHMSPVICHIDVLLM